MAGGAHKAFRRDEAKRLERIRDAADRRADSLDFRDPERAFQIAQADLALFNLSRLHSERLRR